MNKTVSAILALVALLLFAGCAKQGSAPARAAATTGITEQSAEKLDETPFWLQQYFEFNSIKPQDLSVGMKVEDVVSAIGEPTKAYKVQNGRVVAKPDGEHEDWLEWYHSPMDTEHVAPFIRCRIQNGVVKEFKANRM